MGADVLPKLRLCFGQRWCQRFYKRHHFTSRVATTKMRDEIPADYERKKETFILHLSKAIHDHNVPDELICAGDETNTQFVPSVKKTRAKKGCRRVRIIGVGKEKPQITVTISHTATGDILDNIVIAPVDTHCCILS